MTMNTRVKYNNQTMMAATNIAVATHTRRMRAISDGIGGAGQGSSKSMVYRYVGANPVMKKTTRMLRKQVEPTSPKKGPRRQEKQAAKIPRRASQETIKKKNIVGHISRSSSRGRISTPTKDLSEISFSDMPRAPRRKASNPFLRGGLVGQTSSTHDGQQLTHQSEVVDYGNWRPRSPVLTRSRSKQTIHVVRSNGGTQPPRLPHREASIPDALSNARWNASSSVGATAQIHNSQALPATHSLYQMTRTTNNNNKVSFMDLEWAKMSISDGEHDVSSAADRSNSGQQRRFSFEPSLNSNPRTERAPRAPRRKASSMDLDDI